MFVAQIVHAELLTKDEIFKLNGFEQNTTISTSYEMTALMQRMQ